MSELSRTLHPMTVGDILDRSIQLYRSNFLKFVGIVLLVKGPYLILGYVLTKLIVLLATDLLKGVFVEFLTASATQDVEQSATQMAGNSATIIAFMAMGFLELLFVGPILIAAMTMAISDRFLDRDIGVAEAYRKILDRFLPLLGTILLRGMIIFVVLLTCGFLGLRAILVGGRFGLIIAMSGLVLAVVLWVRYAFISQTVVLEGEGGFSAMKRSKYLVRGHFVKAFVLLILIFVAVALVTGLISYGIVKSFFFLGQYGNLLGEGASNVLSVLLEPFKIATVTLLYYDFRIRKEGFDLEIMAEELEAGVRDDYHI